MVAVFVVFILLVQLHGATSLVAQVPCCQSNLISLDPSSFNFFYVITNDYLSPYQVSTYITKDLDSLMAYIAIPTTCEDVNLGSWFPLSVSNDFNMLMGSWRSEPAIFSGFQSPANVSKTKCFGLLLLNPTSDVSYLRFTLSIESLIIRNASLDGSPVTGQLTTSNAIDIYAFVAPQAEFVSLYDAPTSGAAVTIVDDLYGGNAINFIAPQTEMTYHQLTPGNTYYAIAFLYLPQSVSYRFHVSAANVTQTIAFGTSLSYSNSFNMSPFNTLVLKITSNELYRSYVSFTITNGGSISFIRSYGTSKSSIGDLPADNSIEIPGTNLAQNTGELYLLVTPITPTGSTSPVSFTVNLSGASITGHVLSSPSTRYPLFLNVGNGYYIFEGPLFLWNDAVTVLDLQFYFASVNPTDFPFHICAGGIPRPLNTIEQGCFISVCPKGSSTCQVSIPFAHFGRSLASITPKFFGIIQTQADNTDVSYNLWSTAVLDPPAYVDFPKLELQPAILAFQSGWFKIWFEAFNVPVGQTTHIDFYSVDGTESRTGGYIDAWSNYKAEFFCLASSYLPAPPPSEPPQIVTRMYSDKMWTPTSNITATKELPIRLSSSTSFTSTNSSFFTFDLPLNLNKNVAITIEINSDTNGNWELYQGCSMLELDICPFNQTCVIRRVVSQSNDPFILNFWPRQYPKKIRLQIGTSGSCFIDASNIIPECASYKPANSVYYHHRLSVEAAAWAQMKNSFVSAFELECPDVQKMMCDSLYPPCDSRGAPIRPCFEDCNQVVLKCRACDTCSSAFCFNLPTTSCLQYIPPAPPISPPISTPEIAPLSSPINSPTTPVTPPLESPLGSPITPGSAPDSSPVPLSPTAPPTPVSSPVPDESTPSGFTPIMPPPVLPPVAQPTADAPHSMPPQVAEQGVAPEANLSEADKMIYVGPLPLYAVILIAAAVVAGIIIAAIFGAKQAANEANARTELLNVASAL